MAATPLIKHTWTTSVKNDSGAAVLADAQVITGTNEFNQGIQVAPASTSEMDCGSLPFAKMISLFLNCDQAVSVFTNAADGTGGQVIALSANKAWDWNNTLPTSNPVTANITKIYVTNSGTKVANFRAAFLMNLVV